MFESGVIFLIYNIKVKVSYYLFKSAGWDLEDLNRWSDRTFMTVSTD